MCVYYTSQQVCQWKFLFSLHEKSIFHFPSDKSSSIFFIVFHCSVTQFFRGHRIAIIILLFFIVFLTNPSFSVLGPTIISENETSPKQVALKCSRGRVLRHVPTVNTGTRHKIIHFVCISHIEKCMKVCNKLGPASIAVHPSHPCFDLRHIINHYNNYVNSEKTTMHTCSIFVS